MAHGRNITKREVADRIAAATQQRRSGVITSAVALEVVQSFMDIVVEELGAGNRLEFRDFGVFETAERKARMALNPKTLEKVPTPAKRVVKFKPGRAMAERVQNSVIYGIGIGNPAAIAKAVISDEPAVLPEGAKVEQVGGAFVQVRKRSLQLVNRCIGEDLAPNFSCGIERACDGEYGVSTEVGSCRTWVPRVALKALLECPQGPKLGDTFKLAFDELTHVLAMEPTP